MREAYIGIGIIFFGIIGYFIGDSAFQPEFKGNAEIKAVYYIPEDRRFNPATKMMQTYPAHYQTCTEFKSKKFCFDTGDRNDVNNIGDYLVIDYYIGRFSNEIKLVSFN